MTQRRGTKTRIIDIARRVGVSKSAAACVLNSSGQSVIRVSAAKRAEILRVAREMNYMPNITARALAGKSSMKLGALIDSCAPHCIYRLLWAFEAEAVRDGYQLMIGQAHDSPESLFQCYDNFMRHGIEGVVCLAHEYPGSEDTVRSCFQERRNLVYLDPPSWPAPYVEIDRGAGSVEAVRHLQATGRKKIALWLINDSPSRLWFSSRQRLLGYRAALDGEEFLRFGGTAGEYAEEVIAHRLDAVIAANDMTAAHLARELLKRGVRIPDDVALIGHDNDDFSRFYYPSLTTIDQHGEAVGAKLFSLLMAQLRDEPGENAVIPASLIVRESSARSQIGAE